MAYTGSSTDYPCKKGTPSYKEKNDIFPVSNAKKKNPSMEKSLFNAGALGSEIPVNGKYAKKGKGGGVNKGVTSHKTNQISPDGNY